MGRSLGSIRILSLLSLASLSCSCSSTAPSSTAPSDVIGAPADTPADPPPITTKQARCNPRDSFAEPVSVAGLESVDGTARFTDDELGVVFSNRTGDGWVDLYEARRPSIAEPFGAPKKIAGLGGTGARMFPALAKDDRMLWFAFMQVADDGPRVDIFSSSRPDPSAPFGEAKAATALNVFRENTTPFAAKHAPEVWFAAGPNANAYAIFRSKLDGDTAGRALQVTELDTTYAEASPVLSDDGLVVYWSSTRPDGDAKGDHDVWYATRSDTASRFGTARNVASVNTIELEYPAWLSPDMCRLYLVRGAGPTQLFVATRTPR
jgi:hypothetical protein